LGYLSISQLKNYIFAYLAWGMDFTGPQMVLTMKLSSFGYNVHDGRVAKKADNKLTDRQKAKAVERFPSLLEFFGYTFFFGSFLAGPATEFNDYMSFTDRSMFKKSRVGFPSLALVARPFFTRVALLIVAFFAMEVSKKLPIVEALTPEFLLTPMLFRIVYISVATALGRWKYYFGWTLADSICVLAGFGYAGEDERTGEINWGRCTNCDIAMVEAGDNIHAVVNVGWNKAATMWLKNYVYERLPRSLPREVQTQITMLTSALWHGFYPGYYLTFGLGAFAINAARELRRILRRGYLRLDDKQPAPMWYNIGGKLLTFFVVNNLGVSFLVLSWERSFAIFQAGGWPITVAVVISAVVLRFVGPKDKKPVSAAAKAR
jgi:lysophospholipid acyltransferase